MILIYSSIILMTFFLLIFGYNNELRLQKKNQYNRLKAIVSSVAIHIDGDEHLRLTSTYTSSGQIKSLQQDSIYYAIHKKLNTVAKKNEFNSPIYTLVYDSIEKVFFYGIRSDDFIDFRNHYIKSPAILIEKMEEGGFIPFYKSENGSWISAFYPIKSQDGKVVAILEADIEFSEFEATVIREYVQHTTIALIAIVMLALFIIYVTRKILDKDQKQKELVLDQKKTIEARNKDIMASIRYALKIQSATLPSKTFMETHLKESFVFHKAKDVVAGDFYWMEKVGDHVFVAVGDCTGHGVPGAMVSFICSNALQKVICESKISDTGKILNKVRELVIERLNKGEETMSDGMDIALCRINLTTLELQYSGANNPIYIISNETVKVITPNKQPIGRHICKDDFKANIIQLKKNDVIYLFTDGYADQFGGRKGKKFKYKPFKELLLKNVNKSMAEQKEEVVNTFNSWMGEYEQIDDVCVMGIRL